MSRAQAFQIFRQCSNSFSSRHVARTSFNAAAARRIAGARFYSEQATTGGQEKKPEAEGKKGENGEDVERVEETEKDEVEVTPEHELKAKLKAKETEVTDLMVSIYHVEFIKLY